MSNLDGIDIFEPDALDRSVEAYENLPLPAQIAAGFTPAGLAADVATAAKYGRDAVRQLVAGKYGEAAAPAILAALAGVGLIPVVGDIAKKYGSRAVKDSFQPKGRVLGDVYDQELGGYTGQELIEKYNLNPNLSEADAYADLARRYQADKGQNPNLTYMMPRPKGSDDSVKSRIAAGQTSSGLDTRIHQEGDEYFTVDGSKIFKGNMKHKYFEYQLDPDTIPPNTKVERLQTVEGKPQKVGEFVHKPSLQGMADGGVVENIDIFSEESMFRDPVYEEMGFIFDPERNEYFEMVDNPEHGRIRSYIPPRDIAVQRSIEKSRVGRIYGPDESPFDNREVTIGDRVRDLLFQKQIERSDRLDEYERQQEERLKERERKQQSQSFQSGGAVENIDIFDDPNRDPVYEDMGFSFDNERGQYFEVVSHPEYGVMRQYISPRDQSPIPALSDARTQADLLSKFSKNNVRGLSDATMKLALDTAAKEIDLFDEVGAETFGDLEKRALNLVDKLRSGRVTITPTELEEDYSRLRSKIRDEKGSKGLTKGRGYKEGGEVDIFGYVGGGSVVKELLDLAKTTGKTQKERVTEDFPVEVYHGTDSAEDIDIFDPDAGTFSRRNTGTFVTESPTQASTYGKSVMPLQINDADFAVADFNGNFDSASEDAVLYLPDGEEIEIGFMNTDDVARLARSKGVAGVRFDGLTDLGGRRYPDMSDAIEDYITYGNYQYAVFDPTRIKSRFAVGDPSEKSTGQIMKSVGGLGSATGLGLLAAPEEAEAGVKGGIADLIVKDYFDARFDSRAKEQDMLANLEAEIIGSNYTQPMPRLALSELEGEQFVTSMADRTRAGGDVKSINRVQLVDPIHLPGGQDFMFNNPSGVWASAEMPSRQILEMARNLKSQSGRDPLYIPWRMAPTGGDFSTTTGELMLGYAASNMTKATKKALDKSLRDYRTKGSMKDGKRVGAGVGFGKNWFGIDDPRAVEAWRNAPDGLRKELMKMMDVQFRNKGGLSIGAARLINADPKQLMARDAGIQNVGRIFADIDIFDSAHPSYPFVVPGGGVGVLENASAATAFDLLPKARFGDAQKKVKDPANPTQQEIRALQMKPYGGTITEDILRRMEARGVDVNSIAGLTGGALTFTLLSAGLVTPQEVQAGALKEFADNLRKADEMGLKTDQILYHGSTFDIEEFVPSSAGDNDFGQGTYLTISPSDASRNYAGEGPDLTNRINTLSESIQESLEGSWSWNADFWDKINDPEVFARIEKLVDEFDENRDRGVLEEAADLAAKTILKGQNEGVIYPVFVNNNDFAVIGGKNRTVIDIDREQYYESAREEIKRSDFGSDDDYEEAVFEYAQELEDNDYENPIQELADNLRYAGASDEAVDKAVLSAMDGGQIDLTEINEIIRGSYSEDLDTGELLNNGQIMQSFLTNLGYKGVVDNTAGQKFAGMGSGGMHTIVFPGNENLIRSINAKFDPAKADSPNILASAPPILAPTALGIGALGSMQEARADALAAEGAGTEVILDALSGIASPIAGGAAGLMQYTSPLGFLLGREGQGQRIREARETVSDALDYEPRSELAKEMSQKAQEGIAQLATPVVRTLEPVVTGAVEQITDPQNVSPLGLLYRGGKYLYEDIFGEPEREAAKSAMDVVL